jgi:hypothetical protein
MGLVYMANPLEINNYLKLKISLVLCDSTVYVCVHVCMYVS